MARQIVVSHQGVTTHFDFTKLDRSQLYGKRTRMLLDSEGQPCTRASLTADGAVLVRAGMTAQGYFTGDGRMVPSADLVGLGPDDEVLPRVDSTLGVEQEAEVVDPSALLDTRVQTIYMLDSEDLDPALEALMMGGSVLRVPFNYRPDFQTEWAFLVRNDEGVFAVIGRPIERDWCELDQPHLPDLVTDEDDDDDLDFDFF
jgi:hypothetical protein